MTINNRYAARVPTGMNHLDYAIIAIIVLGALYGLGRGALRMATTILSLIVGIIAGSIWYARAGELIQAHSSVGPMVADAIGYVVVFFIAASIVEFVGRRLVALVQIIHLNWIDRLGGAFVGAILAAIFAGIDVVILASAVPPDSPILRDSQLAPHVVDFNHRLIGLVPPEVKQLYENKRDELIRDWDAKKTNPAATPSGATSGTL